MQRILAQVHQTTTSSTRSDSTSRSPNNRAVDIARKRFGPRDDVVSGAAVVGGAVAGREAVRTSAAAPLEGSSHRHCLEEGDPGKAERQQLEQQQLRVGGMEQQGLCDPAMTEEEGPEEGPVYVDFEEPASRKDVDVLIAAVSAMVGMMVPESYRWVLWLACFAVTVWFPLKDRLSLSLSFSLGWLSSWWPSVRDEATKTADLDADQDPPPPYVDVDVDVDMGVGVDMGVNVDMDVEEDVGVGDVGVDVSPVGAVGDVGDWREMPIRPPDDENVDVDVEVKVDVSVDVSESEEGGEGVKVVREDSLSVLDDNDPSGGREGALAMSVLSVLKEREEQYGASVKALLAGLSETELEFIKSAGEEEETRLLRQVCFLWLLLET